MGEQSRACVRCGQPLPPASKMTRLIVTEAEAQSNHWIGEEKADSSLEMDLCLQCQIDRAAR
jgi:hypothetical protein